MKVKWGIIGLGQMAQCFAAANENVTHSDLLAVASLSKNKLKDFGKRHGIHPKYSFESYSDLMKCEEVDAIYVALTNNLHFEVMMQGIKHKKHILVEKPATLNAHEMMVIHNAMNDSSVLLSEAFAYLHHPVTKHFLDRVQSGSIGRPTGLNTIFGSKILSDKPNRLKSLFSKEVRHFAPRLGGGCILDLGCYLTSISAILARIACEEDALVPEFQKSTLHYGAKKVEVDAYGELSFNNVFSTCMRASFITDLGQNTTITGTEGEITIENTWSCDQGGFFQNGDFQSVENLIYDNPYSYQIHNFCDWVTENKRMPQFPSHTVDDTLFNMQILDAWKSR